MQTARTKSGVRHLELSRPLRADFETSVAAADLRGRGTQTPIGARYHLSSGEAREQDEGSPGPRRLAESKPGGPDARTLRSAIRSAADEWEGRLWNDERDRVARISEAALRAGVQERAIRLAEKYGEAIAQIMQAIFNDPELALTESQQEVVPMFVRRHLTAASGDGATVEAEVLAIEAG